MNVKSRLCYCTVCMCELCRTDFPPPPSFVSAAVFAATLLCRILRGKLFITFKDLPHLGKALWETPLGVVTQGMDSVVDKFYTGYGDQQPFNKDGINQGTLQQQGNEYLK